jgi:hypothetical protein
MWIERRRQQHRAYWRKPAVGKDYEAFPTKTQAQDFIDLRTKFGRDKVVARHRARDVGQAATVVATPSTPGAPATLGGRTITVLAPTSATSASRAAAPRRPTVPRCPARGRRATADTAGRARAA